MATKAAPRRTRKQKEEVFAPPPTRQSQKLSVELNEEQLNAYRNILKEDSITVITGEAGTGKSLCAMYAGFELLKQKKIRRIIMSRPTVEMGRELGFLKGGLEEKYDVYLTPLVELTNKLGNSGDNTWKSMVEGGQVKAQPLGFIRGLTFDKTDLFLVDEAQGLLEVEMLTALTRMAESSRLVFTGDLGQKDDRMATGLEKLLRLSLPFVNHYELIENQRNPRITEIVRAWNSDSKNP